MQYMESDKNYSWKMQKTGQFMDPMPQDTMSQEEIKMNVGSSNTVEDSDFNPSSAVESEMFSIGFPETD